MFYVPICWQEQTPYPPKATNLVGSDEDEAGFLSCALQSVFIQTVLSVASSVVSYLSHRKKPHTFCLIGYGSIRHRASPGTVFVEVSAKCIDNESRWYVLNLFGVTQSFGQVNPLTEQKGLIVFKLPVEAINAELVWQPGRGAGETPFKLNVPAVAALPAQPDPAAQASTGAKSYRRAMP